MFIFYLIFKEFLRINFKSLIVNLKNYKEYEYIVYFKK